jgi:hypothetical protein
MSKQLASKVMEILDGRSGDKQYRLNAIRELCAGEISKKEVKKPGVVKRVKEAVSGNADSNAD